MGTYNDDVKGAEEISYFDISFKQKKNLKNMGKEYKRYKQFFKYNYLKYLPKDKNARICDMASGIGETVYALKELGYTNVEGIDFDTKNVEFCIEHGLNVKIGSLYEYFKDKENAYDAIVFNDIIEHIEKEKVINVLVDMRKSLKPGGVLITKTVNAGNGILGGAGRYCNFTHEIAYDEIGLKEVMLLGGFDFDKIKIKGSNLFVFWLNPLNYIAWLINSTISLFLICYFILNFKKNRIFAKNIIAICLK